MSERIVFCVKLQKEAPGLIAPPFAGELGQEIYENVSTAAWDIWNEDVMIKVINEHRLNLINLDDFNILLQQMVVWLNLPSGQSEAALLEIGNPK